MHEILAFATRSRPRNWSRDGIDIWSRSTGVGDIFFEKAGDSHRDCQCWRKCRRHDLSRDMREAGLPDWVSLDRERYVLETSFRIQVKPWQRKLEFLT